MKYKTQVSPAKKRVALVAHDNQKAHLTAWCANHEKILSQCTLYSTGTTGRKIMAATQLELRPLLSGPLGGDQQIGAMIAEQAIDMLIFFWDPLEAMPHDPDIKALLRLAAVWNIPVASNQSSADFFISSPNMTAEYSYLIPDYQSYIDAR